MLDLSHLLVDIVKKPYFITHVEIGHFHQILRQLRKPLKEFRYPPLAHHPCPLSLSHHPFPLAHLLSHLPFPLVNLPSLRHLHQLAHFHRIAHPFCHLLQHLLKHHFSAV